MPDSDKPNGGQPEPDKRKRMRSPAYPYVNLETAIKRAKEFYTAEQRNAAPLRVAAKHWNYEEKSSGAAQTAAALISFGLMQDEGTGEKRKLKLTDTALRIVLDDRPDSESRKQAIRTAALTPKIHREIWRKWSGNLPSDVNLKHTLMLDWNPPFNPAAVDGFIKEYKDTIAYAKPDSSAILPVEPEESDSEEESAGGSVDHQGYVPKVGDFVQWEHNGVLGFAEPLRVRELTSDGNYAFVDGQHGAVPVAELIKEKAPEGKPLLASFAAGKSIGPLPPNSAMQEYVVPLANRAKAIFQWPVTLTPEDVEDLKDSLKILERKITRTPKPDADETDKAAE